MAYIVIIIVIVLLMSKAKRISNDHMQIWNQGLNAVATVMDKEYTKKDILLWVRYIGDDGNEHMGSIHVLDESIGIGSTVPVKYLPSDYEHTISPIERWFVGKEDPNPIYS